MEELAPVGLGEVSSGFEAGVNQACPVNFEQNSAVVTVLALVELRQLEVEVDLVHDNLF